MATATGDHLRDKVPLVFVPGLKGSVLADVTGKTAWVTGLQALGLSTPPLALPLNWNDGVQQRDLLRPSGILAKVSVIPHLLDEKVYGPWLEAAARMNRPFHPFAYDWRRDNLESLAGLEAFIDSIRGKYGVARVKVVAHSMGGLLTLALLNRRPEIFHSVVFAGVPFAGGIGFLPDLHVGTPVGLNRRILAPEVLFSFPSVYSLFPTDGSGLENAQGQPVAMDFYSVDGWKRHRLGIFSEDHDNVVERERYLDAALKVARNFRALLQPEQHAYPPIIVVASGGLPTLARARLNGPKSIRGVDFDTSPKEPGDGRVRLRSALPPGGISYRLIASDSEHTQLLNDPSIIEMIGNLE